MADSITNPESVSTSAEHHDGVSPTPWRVIKAYDDEPARIIDADDDEVAVELIDADAALIVEAVNDYNKPDLHCNWRELTPEEAIAHCREVAERLGDTPCARSHLQLAAWIEERDRLRDLVRRLVSLTDNLLSNYEFRYRDDANSMAFVENARGFLREAREAIGKEEP